MADEENKTEVIVEAEKPEKTTEEAEAAEVAALEAQRTVEVEGRAKRMGWRPKEQYRGPPERWTDAKTFVERGETELPVIRERYRALDDRFVKLEERAVSTERELTSRLKDMSSAFDEFRQFASKADERAYKRAKAELDFKMEAAVQTADHTTYRQARAELDALEADRPAPPVKKEAPVAEKPKEVAPQVHPDVTAWIGENPWFNNDAAMQQYAVALHAQLLKDRPGLSMRENLADVREDIVARFPEKFENKRREAPAAVTTTSTAGSGKKKSKYPDYNDWPADAKAAFAKFSKQMPNYTKDEYAKLYFAGDEK